MWKVAHQAERDYKTIVTGFVLYCIYWLYKTCIEPPDPPTAKAESKGEESMKNFEELWEIGPGEGEIMIINAKSARSNRKGKKFAEISINNSPVKMPKNENGNFRGLHIVILDPKNGKIENSQVFDTFKSSDALEEFIKFNVPDGKIVIAACQDECTSELSEKAKKWFLDMGSNEILDLKYREGFAFIGISGQKQGAFDKKSGSENSDDVVVQQIFKT